MATVEFSPAMATNTYGNAFAYQGGSPGGGPGQFGPNNSYYGSALLKSGGSSSSVINICKGTRPTTFQTSYSAFSPDILMQFTANNDYNSVQGPVTAGITGTTFWTNVTSRLVTATQTGVATYFALLTSDGTTVWQQVTGTVGAIGSGADLEISSTSITSGSQYRISQLRFEMPLILTY